MATSGASGGSGAAATSVDDSGFTFHDFLSIINPLQHLPVIGTLYRAITGDTIKTPEKIAGDALYGGLWGAVASVADTAFQAVTGKDVGDTVLALLTGDHSSAAPTTAIAANAPVSSITPSRVAPSRVTPTLTAADLTAIAAMPAIPASAAAPASAAQPVATTDPNIAALTAALASKGFDSDTAQRAIFAYRRSMALPSTAVLATAQ